MGKFDCNRLLNEYALSCIESYLLYLISEKRSDWPLIFSESYLPFIKVVELFREGQNYSHFKGISRLQKVAERYGFCKLKYVKDGKLSSELIYKDPFAMQVNREYMRSKYGKELWRDDHYIFFKYSGNDEFNYINNIPVDSGNMTISKILDIYDGCIITFEMDPFAKIYKKEILGECIKNIIIQIEKKDENNIHNTIEMKEISLEDLRDIIGVSKIIVKRMEAFVKAYDTMFCLSEYYNYLSRWYIKLEYARLKKDISIQTSDIIAEINDKDNLFSQNLLKKAKEIWEKT